MKRHVTGECLYKLKVYMSVASTRTEAYKRLAEEYGVSVAAIKTAASRACLTLPPHSLQYSFTIEEEDAIAAICIKNARQGTPLTIPDFIEMLSRYKNFPDGHRFSRHFVSDFVDRHSSLLKIGAGKVTSPTRSLDNMDKLTEKFIADLTPLIESNTLNKNNMFVFDETIIGDSDVKQLFIGERRKSGGGSITVFKRRSKALGCFIPFSKCDGTTPFRVFITKDGKPEESGDSPSKPVPNVKVIRT